MGRSNLKDPIFWFPQRGLAAWMCSPFGHREKGLASDDRRARQAGTDDSGWRPGGVAWDLAFGIVEFLEGSGNSSGGYGGSRGETARRTAQDRGYREWQGSGPEAGHCATDRARKG